MIVLIRIRIRIRVNDDPIILESQNLFQYDRPPTVPFSLAGYAEILLLSFPSFEEMAITVLAYDVTLDH